MFALIFVAAASLVWRMRYAGGVERQQIKWVAYAGALAGGASFPTYTVLEAVDLRWLHMVGYVPALIGIIGVPMAVGIAILRYRLYEIDILINRTLVPVISAPRKRGSPAASNHNRSTPLHITRARRPCRFQRP